MRDQDKTKAQLIVELTEYRRQLRQASNTTNHFNPVTGVFSAHGKILENFPGCIQVTSQDGTIVYTNPAFDTLFGYESGELTGQDVSILNSGDSADREQVVETIKNQLHTHGIWAGELRNRKKNGEIFTSFSFISAMVFGGNQYWITVQHDIENRKNLETALMRSEEKYRTLFENMAQGTF